MDRCTDIMRQKHLGFLLHTLDELCIALLCPEKTHETDLRRRTLQEQ